MTASNVEKDYIRGKIWKRSNKREKIKGKINGNTTGKGYKSTGNMRKGAYLRLGKKFTLF